MCGPVRSPVDALPCGACAGEGVDRAGGACGDCGGTGTWRPGAACPCGCGAGAKRLGKVSSYAHVLGCGDPSLGAVRPCPTCFPA